ncbi:hypothetical protein L202_05198 [Cryptococcus amylolentus CBS 6039]|uniref:Uncharacterized protein n=1 Tax=Cryptococcus amylolentus CBS 6039 TaxID=1295533 RepID=A0A1E3HJJ9_9TREE|nr:hypothetical protein L202_05198 [Cryptococcus amylolentus CBS 6039]ODN76532.1 hypothetical protein L202_05198 [Cryptococcus amylolentus CBS 6039]
MPPPLTSPPPIDKKKSPPPQAPAPKRPPLLPYPDNTILGFPKRRSQFESSYETLLDFIKPSQRGLDHKKLLLRLAEQVSRVGGRKYVGGQMGFGVVEYLAEKYAMLARRLCKAMRHTIGPGGQPSASQIRLLYQTVDEGELIVRHFSRLRIARLHPWQANIKWKADEVGEGLEYLMWRLVKLVDEWDVSECLRFLPQSEHALYMSRLYLQTAAHGRLACQAVV